MLRQIKRDKKAVSVMIGYVLLVTIAVVMGSIVYQSLKTYVPKDSLECPSGTSILLEEYTCTLEDGVYTLNLRILNNGRFDIAGYLIHATNSSEQELATIDLSNNLVSGGMKARNAVLFLSSEKNSVSPNTAKDSVFSFIQDLNSIEITPVRYQTQENKEKFVVCGTSKLKEDLICTTAGPQISEESCDELGWNPGADLVCGASRTAPLPTSCSGQLNYENAKSYCEDVGARLCTIEEIDEDQVKGTGCGYDAKRIWSSSSCDTNSHYTQAGRNYYKTTYPLECVPDSNSSIYVRCCADVF